MIPKKIIRTFDVNIILSFEIAWNWFLVNYPVRHCPKVRLVIMFNFQKDSIGKWEGNKTKFDSEAPL